MARGGARPGAGRPARKSPNTSPVSARARARARVEAGNQRPWPADKVERWAIDRLIPYAKNARTQAAGPRAASRSRYALDPAVIAAGKLPDKAPIVTSAANPHYQKRVDELPKLAAAGDWAAVPIGDRPRIFALYKKEGPQGPQLPWLSEPAGRAKIQGAGADHPRIGSSQPFSIKRESLPFARQQRLQDPRRLWRRGDRAFRLVAEP